MMAELSVPWMAVLLVARLVVKKVVSKVGLTVQMRAAWLGEQMVAKKVSLMAEKTVDSLVETLVLQKAEAMVP